MKMRSLVCLLLACTVGLALAACGRRESQAGKTAKTEALPAQLASWKIQLQAAEPVVPDQPTAFTATVKDSAGQAVADAQVELSLTMKTMDMGENRARLTQTAPGVYAGKATFTMAGPWQVETRVTRNGVTALERFPYLVTQPNEETQKKK